jgi:hypothetical protein
MDRATAPEKNGSRYNPQHDSWLIHGSIPSFSPEPAIKAVGVKPPSVNGRLLGLLGPYHQHAMGTFNTCSRGSTHRSLTNTGGGYKLGGADLLHHTPRPSQPTVLPFPPKGPAWSPVLTIYYQLNQSFKFNGTYGRHVVFWPLGYLP